MHFDAEAYERFMGRWSSMLAPQLVQFTDLPDGGRVLDVGTGSGSLAFAIARRNPHCQVFGIDTSRQYVGRAEKTNPFPDRVKFEVGDAQHLPFSDSMFENSLSMLVFNFIPDRKNALAEMMRATRPGGRVSAAVWDYGQGMEMLRAFWDCAVKIDPSAERFDERNMPLCREGELPDFWIEGGLEQVEGQPLKITMQFESFADYWEPFLLGQGPAGAYVRKIDDRQQEAVRGELKRRLGLEAEDVPFSLPARAWAVKGTVRKSR